MSKKSYLSRLIILVLTFNIIVSTSYAYFVGTVDNMSGTSAADVTTSHLKINYSENNHLNLTGMLPGAVFIKSFNIENTGEDVAHYGLELTDVYNEDVDELEIFNTELEGKDKFVNEEANTKKKTTKKSK